MSNMVGQSLSVAITTSFYAVSCLISTLFPIFWYWQDLYTHCHSCFENS